MTPVLQLWNGEGSPGSMNRNGDTVQRQWYRPDKKCWRPGLGGWRLR